MPSFTVYRGSENGIKKSQTNKLELTGDQVLLKVEASGICGTDLHYHKNDMVLGHEGAGVVEETGPETKHLKRGDRVGWGYMHDSCGDCQQCLMGNENYCPERKTYARADLDQGSFAYGAVWREAFLFKLPEGMDDVDAAPLMCAGATVFNALHAYNTQPTDTVGIVGVGGLGHLAIQFASKMGCKVVVLSSSDTKRNEAMVLGATEFVAMNDKKDLPVSRKIDRLLVTTSALPDWNLVLPLLSPGGTIHALSADRGHLTLPNMPIVANGLAIQGSLVASRYVHRRMLDFAALHKIKPISEKFAMTEDGIAEAIDRLSKGTMRYRGVLIPQ